MPSPDRRTSSPTRPPTRRGRRRAYLSLGSNRGDRLWHLERALPDLAALGIRATACSPVYRTKPVGGPPQDDFLNLVIEASTGASPRALLGAIQAVERAHGRNRALEERWGPRTLDVDLLLLGGERVDDEGLSVPHPRLHLRRFVLEPLAQIAPDVVDPRTGTTIRELLRLCPDRSPVVPVAPPLPLPPPLRAQLQGAGGSATVSRRAARKAPHPAK